MDILTFDSVEARATHRKVFARKKHYVMIGTLVLPWKVKDNAFYVKKFCGAKAGTHEEQKPKNHTLWTIHLHTWIQIHIVRFFGASE